MSPYQKNITIEIRNLTKRFGNFVAVRKINLRIGTGERYALIGANGAGKTTLMKCLVGLLAPSLGTATVAGYDVTKEPMEAKKMFGYIPDDTTVYDYLTGTELLYLTGNLRRMEKEVLRKRIHTLIRLFPIGDIMDRPMSSYSRGNKQKVAFLSALLSNPPVLLIDEPVAGLDPASIHIFGKTLQKYSKEGNTVLFISHSLPFTRQYATRVGFMEKGSLAREASVSQISSITRFAGL